jgi:hypothetical protein
VPTRLVTGSDACAEIHWVTPFTTSIIPKVAMKDGTPSPTTSRALARPTATPARSPTSTAQKTPTCGIMSAKTTPLKGTTFAKDRSISPAVRTKTLPTARMLITVAWAMTFWTLSMVMKPASRR